MKIYIRAFLFLLTAVILSSCIGLNRQIRLNADGSGSEKITLRLNKNFIMALQNSLSGLGDDSVSNNEDMKELEALFKDTMYLADIRGELQKICRENELVLKSVKETEATDSTKTLEIKYTFDNVKNLIGDKITTIQMDDMPDESKKKISPVEFKEGDDYSEFSYKLGKNSEADTLQQYDSLKLAADKIMEMVFGNGTITFDIRTENNIISSNADSWSGKKAVWTIPMVDYIRKVKYLKVKFKN